MGLFGNGRKRVEWLEAELSRYQTANQDMAQRLQQLGAGNWLDLKQAVGQAQEEWARVEQERAAAEARLAEVNGQVSKAQETAEAMLAEAQKTSEAMRAEAQARVAKAQEAGDARLAETEARISKAQADLAATEARLGQLRAEAGLVEHKIELQNDGFYDYEHPAEHVIRLQDELLDVRARAKSMVAQGTATAAAEYFTFNNSATKGLRFTKNMKKLMLRSYNAEAENCVLTVKAGRLETALNRLQRAKDQAERLGSMISLRIDPQYHWLRCRELELASQVADAKKAQKEAEAEERARLREEKKAQQELERERQRLLKEQAHYQTVLDELRSQGRADEASEMEARLADIGKAIDDVDYRAANIRAGYVYVISNVGSFGPSMVKIGMTRRLDPMDRVRELSDASVPFNFDVHALFFSDDAVGVESELHHRFAAQRVNLINKRREFFSVTPARVKQEMATINGALLEFVDEPEAEQYRESQRMRAASSPVERPVGLTQG